MKLEMGDTKGKANTSVSTEFRRGRHMRECVSKDTREK
jgi:hypothetical protein